MWVINLAYMTADNASPLVADETQGTVLITIKMLVVPFEIVFLSNASLGSRKLFIQIIRRPFSRTWRRFKLFSF